MSTWQLPTTSSTWRPPTIPTMTSLPPSRPLQRRPAARCPSFFPSRPKPPSSSVCLATPCKTRTRIRTCITAPIVTGAVVRQSCACHSRATAACPIFTWPKSRVTSESEGLGSYEWSGKEGSDKLRMFNKLCKPFMTSQRTCVG